MVRKSEESELMSQHASQPAEHDESAVQRTWLDWIHGLPLVRDWNLRCTDLQRGRATLILDHFVVAANPNGAVHGGVVAAILDQALGIVAVSVCEPGSGAVTATLNIEYRSPASLPVEVRARVERSSRALTFVSADVVSRGAVVAAARGTFVPMPEYFSKAAANSVGEPSPFTPPSAPLPTPGN
jgi:uncharacterized protein (TIGR00369 family)